MSHKGTKIWTIVTAIVLVLAIVINVVLLRVPIVTNSLNLVFGGERAIVSEKNNELTKAQALAAAEDFVIEDRKSVV